MVLEPRLVEMWTCILELVVDALVGVSSQEVRVSTNQSASSGSGGNAGIIVSAAVGATVLVAVVAGLLASIN